MKKPKIKNIDVIHDNKYLKLYGEHWDNGAYYLVTSRRPENDLIANKSDEEIKTEGPDAVTCILVLRIAGGEPMLYMEHEFRYPAGRFLLSPPAGLIDPADRKKGSGGIISAAIREIKEETGITVKNTDKVTIVGPFFYSSPGMTDESNAMVCAEVALDDLSSLNNDGCEGTELFDGYSLLSKEQAKKALESCTDEQGGYFSIYTWCALAYFVNNF